MTFGPSGWNMPTTDEGTDRKIFKMGLFPEQRSLLLIDVG